MLREEIPVCWEFVALRKHPVWAQEFKSHGCRAAPVFAGGLDFSVCINGYFSGDNDSWMLLFH